MPERRLLTGPVTWVVWGLVGLSFVVAAWGIAQVPAGEQVPIHWNAAGEADGFGSRWWMLLAPAIGVLLVGLFTFIVRAEPRQAHMAASIGPLRTLLVTLAGFTFMLTLATTLSGTGRPVDVGAWISVAVGVLIAVIGNMLGKIRSTYTFGVRTPWTLASERSWQRTHRATGFIWVVVGLATATLGLFGLPEVATIVLLVGLLLSVAFAFVYSYRVWRDDPDKEATA